MGNFKIYLPTCVKINFVNVLNNLIEMICYFGRNTLWLVTLIETCSHILFVFVWMFSKKQFTLQNNNPTQTLMPFISHPLGASDKFVGCVNPPASNTLYEVMSHFVTHVNIDWSFCYRYCMFEHFPQSQFYKSIPL